MKHPERIADYDYLEHLATTDGVLDEAKFDELKSEYDLLADQRDLVALWTELELAGLGHLIGLSPVDLDKALTELEN